MSVLPRAMAVHTPKVMMSRAPTVASLGQAAPSALRTPKPRADSMGTVPSQNAAMSSAPPPAEPVPPAMMTNCHNQPQGKRKVSNPIASARPPGGKGAASRCPAAAHFTSKAGGFHRPAPPHSLNNISRPAATIRPPASQAAPCWNCACLAARSTKPPMPPAAAPRAA